MDLPNIWQQQLRFIHGITLQPMGWLAPALAKSLTKPVRLPLLLHPRTEMHATHEDMTSTWGRIRGVRFITPLLIMRRPEGPGQLSSFRGRPIRAGDGDRQDPSQRKACLARSLLGRSEQIATTSTTATANLRQLRYTNYLVQPTPPHGIPPPQMRRRLAYMYVSLEASNPPRMQAACQQSILRRKLLSSPQLRHPLLTSTTAAAPLPLPPQPPSSRPPSSLAWACMDDAWQHGGIGGRRSLLSGTWAFEDVLNTPLTIFLLQVCPWGD